MEIPESSCHSIVDVGFILDSSGSLKLEYGIEKDFLKLLAATFGVNPIGSRAGVITFGSNAELSIKLNSHTDILTFWDAVNNITFMNSWTYIDRALRLAQSEMFSVDNGGRPGIPKLIVLFTDGTQTKNDNYEDPAGISEELRNEGINLLVVGMGQDTNVTELIKIAGGTENVFNKISFADLLENQFINDIRETSCKIGK